MTTTIGQLNELLEAERAGVEAMSWLMAAAPTRELRAFLENGRDDEAWSCAGLAGAINTVAHGVVSLDAVHWRLSGEVVMMTLLGGSTTVLGPFVGAAVVRALEHFLASSTAAVGIVTGAVFVVTVLFFRRGVVGSLLALDHYFAARHQVKALASPKPGEPQPGEARAKS